MNVLKLCTLILISIFALSCATNNIVLTETIVPEKSLYERFIDQAEKGDAEALVKIGISYEEGNGVSVSFHEAYVWYKKAASKGNNEAYYKIGTFFEFGFAVEQNWDRALEWYLSSASTGYIPAIEKMIQHNEGFEEEQMKWIKKGMEMEDPYSFFRYALVLEETDPEKAMDYFIRSKETVDINAKGILSIFSINGRYRFFDDNASIQNIKTAADAGNSRCQVFLGWLYEFGIDMDQDMAYAFQLYEDASKENEILAIYNLSRFYGEGIFVDIDPHLSNRFFKQIPDNYYSPVLSDLLIYSSYNGFKDQQRVLYRFLSAKNDIDAMYHLGLLSEDSEAFQWFWMAADNGHSNAMVELAKAYLQVGTLEYDPVQAAVWLMVAENTTGTIDSDLSSAVLLDRMSNDDKVKVSRLFTEIFFSDAAEQNTDFLR